MVGGERRIAENNFYNFTYLIENSKNDRTSQNYNSKNLKDQMRLLNVKYRGNTRKPNLWYSIGGMAKGQFCGKSRH